MPATIIDGKAVAARIRAELAHDVAAFTAEHARPPGLATILVGEDAASAVYVGGKQKACAEVGIKGFDHRLPADATREQVVALIEELNADPAVNGIICQLPVPAHLDGVELTGLVDPGKDVDGLTPLSAGYLALGREGLRPCTPEGVMDLKASGGLEAAPAGYLPWFDVPGRATAGVPIAFGHWSTLGFLQRPDLLSLDTGCVWGGCLSAARLAADGSAPELIQVECDQAMKPGE